MYKLSTSSRRRLQTCHRDIRRIINELLEFYDVTILEGIRSAERQQELYSIGRSKLDGIEKKSKHQGESVENVREAGITPDGDVLRDEDGKPIASFAIDLMPYARGHNAFSGKEKDNRRFYFMMGEIKAISERLYGEGEISHKVRFGLDWDGDNVYDDQNFDDLPHFELEKV